MTLKLDALQQAGVHAARKRAALLFVDGLIFFSQIQLQLLSRTRVAMFDAPLEYMPEVLNRVEVRRARGKLDDEVVHPRVDFGIVVRTGVVLQEAEELMRIEMFISLFEVVLKNITIQLLIQLTLKDTASANPLRTEAAPESTFV